MRALRTVVGIVLVLVGVPALALATAGWAVQRHAGPGRSFSAPLGSVRTDGYAVTVPDVAAVLDRHALAALVGTDRVRVTIGPATVPVVLWLVPTADLTAYLNGVARTEVVAVGFARGAQPVEVNDLAGTAEPAPLVSQSFWPDAPSGQSLEWDRSTDSRTSLMITRADGRAGFAVPLTATIYPTWLSGASEVAAFVGVAALVGALALLARRDRQGPVVGREQVVVLADLLTDRLSDRLVDRLADDVTDRLAARAQPARSPVGALPMPPRHRDVTGELVQVPTSRLPAADSPYIHSAT